MPQEKSEIAEARFLKRQKQEDEGRVAMTEYQKAAKATDEKTARLRALRLAQQSTEVPKPVSRKNPLRRLRVGSPALRRRPADTQ
jgi:hypothetical protein